MTIETAGYGESPDGPSSLASSSDDSPDDSSHDSDEVWYLRLYVAGESPKSVQAFANLGRAATDGAGLRFVCWRGAAENPFMTTAERAAAPLLPDLSPRRPDAPGQFAFADERRVARILEESGWTAVDIQPIDDPCTLSDRDLDRYLARFGPVGLALREVAEPTRARVIETVRAAFDPYVHGGEVRYTAACWMVGAAARD